MQRLIAIIGPTAVGKTKVSIDLARYLTTEVISGDSMLVYRRLNIGTAKPTSAEQQGIPHHLIDIIDPQQEYSVVDFQHQAAQLIHTINKQGRIPILAGGTGLYLRALLEGYQFSPTSGDQKVRQELTVLAQEKGSAYLHDLLREVCPDKAAKLHPNDQRRIIRALEVYRLEGQATSEIASCHSGKLLYNTLVIGLNMDRAQLYERINQRVDDMVATGLIEEVRKLMAQGITPAHQSMQGIGYKEVFRYLNGESDLVTTIMTIKQATRQFAKRQLTWYRKMSYIQWVETDTFSSYEKMMAYIYSLVAGKFFLK